MICSRSSSEATAAADARCFSTACVAGPIVTGRLSSISRVNADVGDLPLKILGHRQAQAVQQRGRYIDDAEQRPVAIGRNAGSRGDEDAVRMMGGRLTTSRVTTTGSRLRTDTKL